MGAPRKMKLGNRKECDSWKGRERAMFQWTGFGKEWATKRNKQGRTFWIEETASENKEEGMGAWIWEDLGARPRGPCRARIFAVIQHMTGNHRKTKQRESVMQFSYFKLWFLVRSKLWGQQKRVRILHDADGSDQEGNSGKERNRRRDEFRICYLM